MRLTAQGELPASLAFRSRASGSFDCVAARFADGNFAQDDKALFGMTRRENCRRDEIKIGGIEVDFQVNGETYFLSLAEDERRWLVFVESATGSRDVPVYVDEAETDDFKLVVDDKERRKILN